VPDIYQFYIHATTNKADFYWEHKLNFTVVCGEEDLTLALPQPGRTTISVVNEQPLYQYLPSLEQTPSELPNPRWGLKLPSFSSSNTNDCAIFKTLTRMATSSGRWDYNY
jgi:hypothetical protein